MSNSRLTAVAARALAQMMTVDLAVSQVAAALDSLLEFYTKRNLVPGLEVAGHLCAGPSATAAAELVLTRNPAKDIPQDSQRLVFWQKLPRESFQRLPVVAALSAQIKTSVAEYRRLCAAGQVVLPVDATLDLYLLVHFSDGGSRDAERVWLFPLKS